MGRLSGYRYRDVTKHLDPTRSDTNVPTIVTPRFRITPVTCPREPFAPSCASASGAPPAALAVGWCCRPLSASGCTLACRTASVRRLMCPRVVGAAGARGISRLQLLTDSRGASRFLPRRSGLRPRVRRWSRNRWIRADLVQTANAIQAEYNEYIL